MTICRRCYWFKQRQPTFGTCWHPASHDQTVGLDELCRHDGFTPKVVWVERKASTGKGHQPVLSRRLPSSSRPGKCRDNTRRP